jgi:N-acetylglucosaminyl-diphospho-decaprenol L-rhamnosyltransferase
MISVIIVQYNHPDLTTRAVQSLRLYNTGDFEVIVVDNGSPDPETRSATEQLTGCTVIFKPVNAGFGAANNTGAGASRGEYLLFLNNDTLVHGEILPQIENYFASTPSCGVVGLHLFNPDGTQQNSSGQTLSIRTVWNMRSRRYVFRNPDTVRRSWVSGAAMAVRRSVFEEVGGFDESYFMYFEDVDICARIDRAGYEIHSIPSIQVEHLGGGSQPEGMPPALQKEFRSSQVRCYTRYSSALDNALLRAYLFLRFFPQYIAGNPVRRSVASHVLSILVRNPDERRH